MNIITRQQWGATTPQGQTMPGGIKSIVWVHHTAIPHLPLADSTPEREVAQMKSMARFHHEDRGWSAAPGYNFVIMQSGRIYEGAGWGRRGIHAGEHNSTGYGISFCINSNTEEPTDAAVAAFEWLVAQGVEGGYLVPEYRRRPHMEVSNTDCPGGGVLRKVVFGDQARPAPPEHMLQLAVGRPQPGERAHVRESIRYLQRLLGMDEAQRDGQFGPMTHAAVVDFQSASGLQADGIVGRQTWAALFEKSEPSVLDDYDGPMDHIPPMPPRPLTGTDIADS